MRLFVALVPPPGAVAALADAVAAAGVAPALRWTPPERWHLTLAFLGDVDDGAAPPLVDALRAAAAAAPPLRLQLTGAGSFGDRVLWAGVDGDVEGLADLAAGLAAAARATGLPLEARPYRPHLTVGRAVGQQRPDLAPLVSRLTGVAGEPWTADEAVVVRSHLGAARYEVLERLPLCTGGP